MDDDLRAASTIIKGVRTIMGRLRNLDPHGLWQVWRDEGLLEVTWEPGRAILEIGREVVVAFRVDFRPSLAWPVKEVRSRLVAYLGGEKALDAFLLRRPGIPVVVRQPDQHLEKALQGLEAALDREK